MLKYIKNNVFNPLSWMGVFFLVTALYFSADISIKCYNNHKELSYREKVECMFTSVSAIRKKREFRHNGNSKTKYYQDFEISYEYDGKVYTKSFKDFYFSSRYDCYNKDSEEYVWVNKNDPADAIISSRFVLYNTMSKQLFIMFGIPGIVIILFPKRDKAIEK